MTLWSSDRVALLRRVVAVAGAAEVVALFSSLLFHHVADGRIERVPGVAVFGLIHAAPFLLGLRRPRSPWLGMTALTTMVVLDTIVFWQFLRDDHSTAGLWLLYSIPGVWLIWIVFAAVEWKGRHPVGERSDGAQSSGAGRAR
jgi:hypothetical protein